MYFSPPELSNPLPGRIGASRSPPLFCLLQNLSPRSTTGSSQSRRSGRRCRRSGRSSTASSRTAAHCPDPAGPDRRLPVRRRSSTATSRTARKKGVFMMLETGEKFRRRTPISRDLTCCPPLCPPPAPPLTYSCQSPAQLPLGLTFLQSKVSRMSGSTLSGLMQLKHTAHCIRSYTLVLASASLACGERKRRRC